MVLVPPRNSPLVPAPSVTASALVTVLLRQAVQLFLQICELPYIFIIIILLQCLDFVAYE